MKLLHGFRLRLRRQTRYRLVHKLLVHRRDLRHREHEAPKFGPRIAQVDSAEFYEIMPPAHCYGGGRCRGVMVFGDGASDLRAP